MISSFQMTRIFSSAFMLLVLSLSFAVHVSAQFETATVLGTVRDPNGSVIGSANVMLRNVATGIASSAITDANGDFQFVNVKIGKYQVIAEADGFAKVIADNVDVTVNARQRVDLTLQVASTVETVTITDAASILESDSSERGQVIQRQQIVSLPLNGRSAANLALLAPGVRESSFNGIGSPGREASFNVNGLRSTVNNFLLDGIDNNAYGTSNQSFSNQVVQVSPDAAAEFKVQTNTYSAEYGRSGGAVINASYRSGTNEFHGSAWEFHRNTVLNAVGFFKPNGGVKPPLIRNQFGFTFGGPIVKDRTFFFGDYEGFRQIQKNLVFSNLPTLAQRNGILTVAVRNPFTGVVIPAGTQIPMTAFAQKVLNELPAPNLFGVPGNNYQELVLNRNFSNKYNIRIDHKFNDRLSIFGRFSNRKSNAFEAPNIPGPSGSNQNGFVDILNRQILFGGTYALENSSVLDLRIGYSKIDAGKRPPLTGGPSMLELYGITGLPDDKMVTGGLTTQTITGFSQLGRQATNPQFQNPHGVDIRFSYVFLRGRHSLKTGYEYLAVNTDVQDTNPLMGLDTYSGQFSRPTGAAANNLYNLADFYFGARSQYELANLLVVNLRQRLHFAYLQDDFKVSPKLTLNLGVRYEFATPFYEKNNRLSNYDPITNTIIQATDGSLYDRSLVDPDYNNFAPRLGFAYNAFSKTVIRGGFGMGYVYFNRLGSANLLATNFPQITRAAIAQTTPSAVNPLCTDNNFSGCFRPTQQGYPSGLPNNVTLFIPRDSPTGYIQNWHFSVQREVLDNTVLDVAYVGNRARNLVLLADFNQARPLTVAEAALPAAQQPTLQARRPIQGFGSISTVLPDGFSSYNALQIKLERRFTRGLYLLNSFTFSKALDNVTQVLEEPNGNTGQPQDIHNIAADKGPSAYDQPFNNTTSFVWDLPLGRGRRFGSDMNGALDAIIGGWTLSGINTMTSGQTINFRYGPSPVTNNLPTFLGGTSLRPNVVCDPTNRDARPNPTTNYFIPTCLQRPPVTAPFGNAGRNIARSDNFFQFDLGVQKQFGLPFGEATSLEFRAEFFNFFNKTNFQAPTADITSSAFGTISSAFPARQVQFALKLNF
jgi:Carboxypeptidase regulatory-like domain/TonB-dependent Receptor Plug Domain/TonB dependent receptor-like, beta-barrel